MLKQKRIYLLLLSLVLSLSLLHCNEPSSIIEEEQGIVLPIKWLIAGSISAVSTSPDGSTWQRKNTTTNTELYDAIYENNLWIIVGERGTILTSHNGINWTEVKSGISTNLYKILFVNNRYYTYGEQGSILSSQDGENWTQIQTNGLESKDIYDVHYHSIYSKWLAVGSQSSVFTSTDGIDWKKKNNLGLNRETILYGISYYYGILVIVGENGTILTSADYSDSFTKQETNTDKNLYDIASGGGNFIVVGADGTLLASNGVDDKAEIWELRQTNTNVFLYAVHYENEQFLATGDAKTVLISNSGGQSWTTTQLNDKETKTSVWVDTNFYTVGMANHFK